jgi:hypothetical protein
MAVWCSLWSLGIFSRFGMFGPRKIWQLELIYILSELARRQGDQMFKRINRPGTKDMILKIYSQKLAKKFGVFCFCTKSTQNVPNGRKISQMSVKIPNGHKIFQHSPI